MHLALEVLAPGVAVLVGVLALLLRADVSQQLVLGEGQLRDHVVELGDRRQLAVQIDRRLVCQRRPALRERPARGTVVLGDVLTAAGDREHVQQLEVVGVHRVHEALGRALLVGQLAPLGEARLGDLRDLGDRGDAVGIRQVLVIALGDELHLVSQIQQAVVHRGGGKHEHLGAHSGLNDVLDETCVAVLLLGVRGLVPEVVGLIDYDEVVVAPTQVLKVDVSRHAVVAGQVRVVEDVIGEAVVGKGVAVIIAAGPERPVLAQALRAEDEHAAVSLLIVFDDGKSLIGLAKADTVGDDAALVLLELADGSYNGVFLEVVELVPDDGFLEFQAWPDGILRFFHEIAEQMVQGQEVDELGRVLAIERLYLEGHLVSDFLNH